MFVKLVLTYVDNVNVTFSTDAFKVTFPFATWVRYNRPVEIMVAIAGLTDTEA